MRRAETHRAGGFWLRAAREFEGLAPRCPNQRHLSEAPLVELVIGLEDEGSAERLLASKTELTDPALRARLTTWLEAWRRAKPDRDAHGPASLAALREAQALATASAAQPHFDRARVALERETGQRPSAFLLPETLREFDDAVWTSDGRELWLWGNGGFDGLAPRRDTAAHAPTAVVFDTGSWEAIWRVSAPSRPCPSVAWASGQGFARCDGIFARDGRLLHALPELDVATVMSLSDSSAASLLTAQHDDEHTSRVGILDVDTAAFRPLELPPVEGLIALGAGRRSDWFFVESSHGLEVFAYPSLQRLLQVKANSAEAIAENQLAFITDGGLEVWQLRPAKRLARHFLPEVVVPHGPAIGASYFRALDSHALWVQFLSAESTWRWVDEPSVSANTSAHEPLDELPNLTLRGVALSSDANSEAQLRRHDRPEFDELRVVTSQGTQLGAESAPVIKSFAVSPNGKRLAFQLADTTLAVIDLDATSAPHTFEFDFIRHLAFYDDEKLALEVPRQTWLVDVRDGTHRALELRPREHFFARGSSGVVVTTEMSNQVSAYDAQGTLQTAFELEPVALSPSGAWLLLKGRDRLALASTTEGTRAVLLNATDVEMARFSADESRLATLGASGLVVWDGVAGNKWRVSARAPLGSVTSLDFSRTNDVVVLGSADGNASAFRYDTGERVQIPAHGGASEIHWVRAARFVRGFRQRDGKWLGSLALVAEGARGFVLSRTGQVDFLGSEPKPGPRCAFGNQLVAWQVCSDELRVPGLLKRLLEASVE